MFCELCLFDASDLCIMRSAVQTCSDLQHHSLGFLMRCGADRDLVKGVARSI